jgi:hypothetical protein
MGEFPKESRSGDQGSGKASQGSPMACDRHCRIPNLRTLPDDKAHPQVRNTVQARVCSPLSGQQSVSETV